MREKIILAVLYVLALLLVFATFSSCRTAKDNRAVNRVLSNPELKEKVGREWEKVNPCVVDSVTVYLPGDTIIDVDTVIKGGRIIGGPGIIIMERDGDYIVTVDEGSTTPPKPVVLPGKVVTVTKVIRDTIRIDKTDLRRLRIMTDSMNFYKGLYLQRDAQVQEFERDKKNPRKITGWLFVSLVGKWWFWLIIFFVAGYLTRNLWRKFI